MGFSRRRWITYQSPLRGRLPWFPRGFIQSSDSSQEKYRRRGLAKALASKIMRQGPGDFALDGWGTADVAADNAGSRRICKSLGGEPRWEVSW